MKRQFLVPAFAALALAAAAPAHAQWGGRDSRPPSSYRPYADAGRIAYDRGFREGIQEGEKDGRRRDRFGYQDERDFRRADVGYNRGYGDIDRYRRAFRSGFADGYEQGYRNYARPTVNRGGYGSSGYPDRRDSYYSAPFDIGARDGYEKGREDGRENRSHDPRRHKWYREGDREYEGRYGNRDQYKNEYRRGFISGYERGYRGR